MVDREWSVSEFNNECVQQLVVRIFIILESLVQMVGVYWFFHLLLKVFCEKSSDKNVSYFHSDPTNWTQNKVENQCDSNCDLLKSVVKANETTCHCSNLCDIDLLSHKKVELIEERTRGARHGLVGHSYKRLCRLR